ncbi:Lar family restriction alleviation protein [Xenorhabdus bovienii]|uniref:Lar family restriction alleviation protein n=1 Tax=Xenorhabdus bovienii TaxID=40576 RepID=UPI003BB1E7F4|nr:Lar family restriction alleviation protein [Xenorhabdus bovienii]
MTDKFKPCPFCNSVCTEMNSHSDDIWFFVQCTDCNADGPEEDTAANAEIAWNRRAENT